MSPDKGREFPDGRAEEQATAARERHGARKGKPRLTTRDAEPEALQDIDGMVHGVPPNAQSSDKPVDGQWAGHVETTQK